MLIETRKFFTYFLVGLISCTINIEGVMRLLIGIKEAGYYNPVLAPIVLILLLGVIFFSARIKFSLQQVKVQKLMIVLFILVLLIFIFGLFGVSLKKSIRDIVHFSIMVSFVVVVDASIRGGILCSKSLINSLFYINVILLPSVSILIWGVGSGFGGRMAGFMLSPPVFANTIFLLTALYLVLGKGRLKFLLSMIPIIYIVLSGTRTALALYVLYVCCFLWFYFPSRQSKLKIFMIGCSTFLVFFIAFGDYFLISMLNSESRITSVGDFDGGSLGTRTLWYLKLLAELKEGFYIGGYGAGSSEHLIGYITHFDFLRYWFDYSIVTLILFIVLLYKLSRIGAAEKIDIIFIINLLILTFLSTHNVFQSPATAVLVALFLYYSNEIKTKKHD